MHDDPSRGETHASGASLKEKSALVAAIVEQETRRWSRRLSQGVRRLVVVRTPSPERLLIAPQDIRTADTTIADDIYAGHLSFDGTLIDAHGLSPFDLTPPTEAWAESLHGFGWLRHLRAANTPLSRANARALVDDWITYSERRSAEVAWRPAVVARRLLSWVSQSPMILAPTDAVFYRRFMRSIGRQTALLQRALAAGLPGETRLFASIALAEVGLCAEGLASARKQGSRFLVEALNRQILPDGGHLSRNPAILVELLLDLLPLRQSFAARSAPVPPALLNAVDRMIPMIRMFRHGDGNLALFNGMGMTEPDVLATVLTYHDVRARSLLNAPHSGYQRIEANGTLLICDVGRPPPTAFSTKAHAGTLAFELSVGPHRMIVNCGRPSTRHSRADEAARSTAAHATLTVADTSSSRFAPGRLQRWLAQGIVSGPTIVPCARSETAGGFEISASHDGYAKRFGVIHRRKLVVSRSGDVVQGEDDLEGDTRGKRKALQPFAVRFHLHPSVRVQPVQGGAAVLLILPDDDRWLFEAPDGDLAVEESVLFAVSQGGKPSTQLVLPGRYPQTKTRRWSLTRMRGDQ